ncbi:MAG: terminase large subunit [Candidatus Amulumruptor caecigallinarius]|nr:terminase large subunit [Candidatus Amulumruptor caecigallinarius]
MTDEEIKRDRRLKRDIAGKLPEKVAEWECLHRKKLDNTDPRIWDYCGMVCDSPDEHNLYEILGVCRFFELLKEYEWNRKRVRRFFRFYEMLKFNGQNGRQSYKLTPVQAFQFGNIFGFDDREGLRLCQLAYIFVPRKFSKTTSAASLAVNDLLFGDNNSQAYVGANSYQQAKICFDEIRNIVYGIDRGGKHLKVNRELICFTDGSRDSKAECLAANARTRDGLNASLVIMDEYAQARNTAGANGADLKNVLTSSMGTRREPLTVVITTASDIVDGPFAHELEGARGVLRGELHNDRMFASIFQPDVDDAEDDPRTWRKVQPHMGVTVREDFYEREYANAQLSPDNMLAFRTKLLNIFCVNDTRSWLDDECLEHATRHVDIEKFRGRFDSTIAIDLSVRDDFSAVSMGVFDSMQKKFFYKTYYFMPEVALETHANRRLYRRWAESGHLILTKGEVIDYRYIMNLILSLNGPTRTIAIGYDPAKSRELINMLITSGAENVIRTVPQRYMDFTSASESFEVGIRTGRIYIDDNPINRFCFLNSYLDEDRMRNKKPQKKFQNGKIDGVITMLMCHKLFAQEWQIPM